MRPSPRHAGTATLAVALAFGLAACGSGSDTITASASAPGAAASVTPSGNPGLASMLPEAIRSAGTLRIGTDSTYAPSEFLDTDGKTVKGFDVDLFDAVAAKLGLKTQWVSSAFADIIPGVQSGKYDIGVSSFTVNPDREKATLMVSYFSAGTQWATQQGNPQNVTPDTACGRRIAVQKATVQVDDITARSKKCTQAGKPAITVDQYQGQDQATTSVVSGKDDAMLADSPVTAYAVKQTNGQLAIAGAIYDSAPYGYVVKKSDTQLAQAVITALKAVEGDGTYKKVLDTWGVSQGALTAFAVNPSVS